MKALVYEKAHELEDFAIELVDLAESALRDTDVLVEARGIGVNPGEAFIRSVRSAEPGGRVLLGWEFAGVVLNTGAAAGRFGIGAQRNGRILRFNATKEVILSPGQSRRPGCCCRASTSGKSTAASGFAQTNPRPSLLLDPRRCCL
jgi:NADPH:quinone reductase-like Zn-dependent oxidoreductase